KISGGAKILHGSESKKKIEEIFKHSKLKVNQENIEVHKLQVQQQRQGLDQQILLTIINFCELEQELAKYMGQFIAGLFQAVQLEQVRTWVTIAVQIMVTVSISRTLLATEATGTNDEHDKVPETEFGQQPCASLTAAAVRCKEWGERVCGSCISS
ncbi:MAG: hypothetical protein EZS28_036895, partial [Streblomastix strix]